MAGAGAGVGAVRADGGVEAGVKPVVVGPYAMGAFGQTPEMYEPTRNRRKLTFFFWL